MVQLLVDKCMICFHLVRDLVTEFGCGHGFQFQQAEETALKLDLDGLVVIGGDDSNTNACLLSEYFRYALFSLGCNVQCLAV